jgi:hypothetical protein
VVDARERLGNAVRGTENHGDSSQQSKRDALALGLGEDPAALVDDRLRRTAHPLTLEQESGLSPLAVGPSRARPAEIGTATPPSLATGSRTPV